MSRLLLSPAQPRWLHLLRKAALASAVAFAPCSVFAQAGGGVSELDETARVQQALARIAGERSALEAGFDAEERACRERFFVNRCLQELAPRRREALSRLRQQELQMEEAERARRQAAALARTAQKRADAQDRPPEESADQAAARLQREQVQREREQAERDAQARDRVLRQQAREREAEQRQRDREDAARARARRSDPQPLPVPEGVAPAAPAR